MAHRFTTNGVNFFRNMQPPSSKQHREADEKLHLATERFSSPMLAALVAIDRIARSPTTDGTAASQPIFYPTHAAGQREIGRGTVPIKSARTTLFHAKLKPALQPALQRQNVAMCNPLRISYLQLNGRLGN
jgi:hypothetical protein